MSCNTTGFYSMYYFVLVSVLCSKLTDLKTVAGWLFQMDVYFMFELEEDAREVTFIHDKFKQIFN
jgi:hypothetical protein